MALVWVRAISTGQPGFRGSGPRFQILTSQPTVPRAFAMTNRPARFSVRTYLPVPVPPATRGTGRWQRP